MEFQKELRDSIEFLNSAKAVEMVRADAYWPKWNSTWWHMLLLYEMGEVEKIPENIVEEYVQSLDRIPLKIFPIVDEDMPEGVDPYRGTPCHCQLGNVYQVLAACGIDVDQRLPWIRPWFLRYQMGDGGFNCDEQAYLVKDETPSSMVGTIAIFESVLLYTNREFTEEEKKFIDLGAKFLIDRQLTLGSSTKYNSSERKSAEDWMKFCFPRYYLYDGLRGLVALLKWSEKTGGEIPIEAVKPVVEPIQEMYPNGEIKIGRHSYEGAGTLMPDENGEWQRGQKATFFPLLEKVSVIGEVSPILTRQWTLAKAMLMADDRLRTLVHS